MKRQTAAKLLKHEHYNRHFFEVSSHVIVFTTSTTSESIARSFYMIIDYAFNEHPSDVIARDHSTCTPVLHLSDLAI